jgi:protein involved in temperature-dependent protein secretion
MAFKSLLKSQVKKTFDLYLQDLAQDVTLTNKTASSYNFATGQTTVSDVSSVTVKGVIVEEKKDPKDPLNTTTSRDLLLINAEDVTDFNLYDSISINGKTFNINSFSNNGFLIEADITGG